MSIKRRSDAPEATPRKRRRAPRGLTLRGFTLTELMVAVVVLIAVIIATSKIFGTASQITGMGQATASLMREAAVIERELRRDLSRVDRGGFFAIRCVSVPNNVHRLPPTGLPSNPLLNPNLPPTVRLRCDQLVFFANGVQGTQTFRTTTTFPGTGTNHKGQGTVSRIYYGHGFQIPESLPYSNGAADVTPGAIGRMAPWSRPITPPVTMVRTQFTTGGSATDTDVFSFQGNAGTVNAIQPPATTWLLTRQCIPLLDDDTLNSNTNAKTVYLDQTATARSIFWSNTAHVVFGHTRELRNGRVDAAASTLDEIRDWITFGPFANGRPWNTPSGSPVHQRAIISTSAIYYPRTERTAPSMHRADQALTDNIIGSAVSSIAFDWTWSDGTGAVFDANDNLVDPDGIPNNGDELFGVRIDPKGDQPWFGMPELILDLPSSAEPDDSRMTFPYNSTHCENEGIQANTIDPGNIDGPPVLSPVANSPGVYQYEAFFGYNHSQPLNELGDPDPSIAYTPFPTAVRVTLTLHDPEGKLDGGREFQFVIDLPKPVK